jgi:putative MATE family efflux protein
MAISFPTMALGTCMRGVGNVRVASVVQVVSLLLNIVLAPFLIFGWLTGKPLGVFGAALATLIANLVSFAILLLYVIRNGKLFDRSSRAWRPQPRLWLRIMSIGVPSGAEFLLMAAYMTFVGWVLHSFGSAEQAAFTIGMRVMQIGMMPGMALAFAASAIVGQNYGAQLPQRVRATVTELLKLNLLTMVGFGGLLHIAPRTLIAVFSNDTAVLDAGYDVLVYLSWNLLASAIVSTGFGIFTGLGNTVPSLIASVLRVAVIVSTVLWTMRMPDFAPRWIWATSVGASVLQGSLLFLLLRRELARRLGPMEAQGSMVAATANA